MEMPSVCFSLQYISVMKALVVSASVQAYLVLHFHQQISAMPLFPDNMVAPCTSGFLDSVVSYIETEACLSEMHSYLAWCW